MTYNVDMALHNDSYNQLKIRNNTPMVFNPNGEIKPFLEKCTSSTNNFAIEFSEIVNKYNVLEKCDYYWYN